MKAHRIGSGMGVGQKRGGAGGEEWDVFGLDSNTVHACTSIKQ